MNAPSGEVKIGVRAGNTATGRNAFVDVLSFPSSGGSTSSDADNDGEPDSTDNCPNVYNPNQNDGDGDGIGNACEDGSTTPPPSSDWPASDCEKDIKPDPGVDIPSSATSRQPNISKVVSHGCHTAESRHEQS